MNEKQQQVVQILAEVLGISPETIKPEQHLKGDLDIDSAQVLELLSEIEDTFEVEISEVQAAKVQTVEDLLALAAAA